MISSFPLSRLMQSLSDERACTRHLPKPSSTVHHLLTLTALAFERLGFRLHCNSCSSCKLSTHRVTVIDFSRASTTDAEVENWIIEPKELHEIRPSCADKTKSFDKLSMAMLTMLIVVIYCLAVVVEKCSLSAHRFVSVVSWISRILNASVWLIRIIMPWKSQILLISSPRAESINIILVVTKCSRKSIKRPTSLDGLHSQRRRRVLDARRKKKNQSTSGSFRLFNQTWAAVAEWFMLEPRWKQVWR